ncbi:site-specific integrase [Bacillus sp. JJ1532]|uniref:tyrosine-type recombinase/integrase n=1 Tax=Bacillus sp. JJ1532 TaxID=3122958 RepID=UPI002FFDCE5E
MATFRKRGNTWEYRVYYKCKRTGEGKQLSMSGYKSKTEARLASVEMEGKIKRGFDPSDANKTLNEFFDWWFETYKKGAVSINTEKNIKNAIEMVTRNIGYAKLSELDRPEYQKLINKVAPEYTKSTLQRMNTTIREAFLDASEEGLIVNNPAARIKYPTTCKKSKKKNEKFLELEEYEELIKVAIEEWTEEYAQYLYISYILAGTGARIGEVCALHVSDLDLDSKSLNFDKTLVRENGEYKTKDTTKTGETGERKIGLDDFTIKKLEDWLHIRKKWVMKLKKRPDFLFINPIGDLVKMPNYAGALKTLCKRNGLKHITPHMFRHTHETIMWEAGISDLNYIGGRLGDIDKTILLETYGHMSNRSELLNTEKINNFMKDWSKRIESVN